MDRPESERPEFDIEGHTVNMPMRMRSETPTGEPVILEHITEISFSRESFTALNQARVAAGAEPVTEQEYFDSVLKRLERMNNAALGQMPKPERRPSLTSFVVDAFARPDDPIRIIELGPEDLDKTPSEIVASLD